MVFVPFMITHDFMEGSHYISMKTSCLNWAKKNILSFHFFTMISGPGFYNRLNCCTNGIQCSGCLEDILFQIPSMYIFYLTMSAYRTYHIKDLLKATETSSIFPKDIYVLFYVFNCSDERSKVISIVGLFYNRF